jgi:hypothetical protein
MNIVVIGLIEVIHIAVVKNDDPCITTITNAGTRRPKDDIVPGN